MKTIEPIAVFHSPFTSKFGIPRQSGLVDKLIGRIVFEPPYNDPNALRGIEGFDYLWLIWGFSANERSTSNIEHSTLNIEHSSLNTQHSTFHPTVRPPRLGGNERIGVFASRSPFRPNGLGLSSVRIVKVEKGEIIVSGADLMDGTPIYDIKPYVPYADAHPEARGGFTDDTKWHRLDVVFPDDLKRKLSSSQVSEITETLSLDPRPHYQDNPDRIYGMPFAGHDIRFRVENGTLYVVEVI